MAVTKIWAIKGRIDRVLSYAANEKKTSNPDYETAQLDYSNDDVQGLYDVMDYAMNDGKTEDRLFVSGINCDPEFARMQMQETKIRHNKQDGIVAFHMYQSFKPGEVTPEIAHEIGVRLARELLQDRFEAVVATHLNTSCVHNHIVINSVSSKDGKKFYSQRKTVYDIRKISDKLCREYGLSVPNPQGNARSYSERQAEKNGEPTKNGIIKRDIDECILAAGNEKQFYLMMKERGYSFRFDRKYPTIHHPDFEKARRLKTLGEAYTPEEIRKRIYNKRRTVRPPAIMQDNAELLFFDGDRNNQEIFKSRQSIYVHFVCGITVVRNRPDENRELMRLLGDEIIKFDKRVEEQNLMLDHNLFTDDDVERYKEELLTELSALEETRHQLRLEQRRAVRADDVPMQNELKSQTQTITKRMQLIRKQSGICDRILSQGQSVEQTLYKVKDNIEKQKRKEREMYEPIRRRSGTGRQTLT